MSNSVRAKIRKKLARELEDEITTVNSELLDLTTKIPNFDYKTLKRVDLEKLRELREGLQNINRIIKKVKSNFESLEKPYYGSVSVHSEENDGQPILSVSSRRLNSMSKELDISKTDIDTIEAESEDEEYRQLESPKNQS
jgi:hypothetical protein